MTKKSATKDPPFDPPQWPAAKVEMWKLDRIKHYPKNPRTHPQDQLDKLAASMRDDGVTMPILVDEAGEIIAGHGRALAAAANGFEEYPVVVARGWSEEKKRAVRLKDNAIGILSGLGLVEKQTEIRATQEVVEDKALTNLRRYAI